MAVAAIAAIALGGSALADAATQSATPTASPTAKDSPRSGGPGAGETALTGDTADKVKAAALAKVPGTVLRVETDNGGVYEAHIKKADGTEVEVKVDKTFTVTGTEDGEHGGRGGHGHGGGPGGGETALTGDTADKVKAAALDKVPGTVLRVETDNGGAYEAHIKKADGTEVEVKVDKDFTVTATEDHKRPKPTRRRATRDRRPVRQRTRGARVSHEPERDLNRDRTDRLRRAVDIRPHFVQARVRSRALENQACRSIQAA